MKKNKNKLNAVEKFQRDLTKGLLLYYRKSLSERAKRGWEKRRNLSTVGKVDM